MPGINRRQVTLMLGGGLLSPLAAPAIVKASNQPIILVMPYAGGGSIDGLVRTIAKGMSEKLKRPVLVENKPGANGIVGSQYVASGPKDGTMLLVSATGPLSLNVMLRKNLSYKLQDFTSVAMLFSGPLTLTVNEKMPANDIKSFASYAKSRSKPLFYATLGPGSVTHLYGIIMSRAMGFQVTDIPYRNNTAGIMELLSGECDMNFATPAAVIEHVRAGKLKIIAISTEKRMPKLPDVSTFAEAGYPELTASFWTGLHAPAGTPADVIATINEAANYAMKTAEVIKFTDNEGLIIETGSPSVLDQQLAKDIALWQPVIKSQNIVLD